MKSVSFKWCYFPSVKTKSVSFGVNEWIFKYSDKIMSCKLWSKVTSVFLNINFLAKIIEVLWEMLTFWNYCALLLKVNILLENMLIFRKFWLFVWMSIYSKNLSNLIKTSIFFRKCLFVHVLIFIRVFLLLENCYFDSKYDFIRWYLWKSVIFLVKFTFQVA